MYALQKDSISSKGMELYTDGWPTMFKLDRFRALVYHARIHSYKYTKNQLFGYPKNKPVACSPLNVEDIFIYLTRT